MKTVVVGGGLAGLATAVELLARGSAVELIEQGPFLGGVLASRVDSDGDHLESGLRWYSRSDTLLLQLLDRVGIADRIRWSERGVVIARPGGATAHVPFPRFPPPFGMLAACLGNDLLTPFEKLVTVVGLLPSWIGTQHYIATLDSISCARWQHEHRFPHRVRTQLIEPIVRSIGWLTSDTMAARPVAAFVHHLAHHSDAAQFGTLDGAASPRLIVPITNYLLAHGATLHTGMTATALLVENGRVGGVTTAGGATFRGDAVVLAVQPNALQQLVPASLRHEHPFAALAHIDAVPALSVQLWFDRYVHYSERLYLTGDACFSTFGDLALASPIEYDRHGGSLVSMSVAPAAPLWQQGDDAVVARCRSDLQRLWPGVRRARVIKTAVMRLPNALYRAAPGTYRFLSDGRTPLPNLFLAGDWTASPGAASMEGAVRSGTRAADCIDEFVAHTAI